MSCCAPEADCPRCGSGRACWDDGALPGRLPLALGRLLARLTRRLWPVRLRCSACGTSFGHLHALDRTVVGYHGCSSAFARDLVAGRVSLEQWRASRNDYDWLGAGVYFWEHAPGRAWLWARQQFGDQAAVVAAEIRLGRCLDLGDTLFTDLLRHSFDATVEWYRRHNLALPKNGGKDFKLRRLDRLIINELTAFSDKAGVNYQTVRCPFEEGEAVFPGGMIRTQSHIQIAVRDRHCITPPLFLVDPEAR